MSTEVDRIYTELLSIAKVLAEHGTPSDQIAFSSLAAKCLLLATASYFEKEICDTIRNYAANSGTPSTLMAFIDTAGIQRKYHTFFDWSSNNINRFIQFFGKPFADFVRPNLLVDEIKEAVKQFIFLGQLRNELVHNNFAEFALPLTIAEIKSSFDVARGLTTFISNQLSAFETQVTNTPNESVRE